MKKDNKKRLFELMGIINEDFIPRSVGIIGTRSTNSDTNTLDLNRTYEQSDNWSKPNGLWYQIGNKWNRLCNINNKNAEFKNYKKHDVFQIKKYNIVLDIDFTDILIIDTNEKLNEFDEKFRGDTIYSVKWSEVAKAYKGIEFPKLKHLLGYKWMDSWDIDSGCIWDLTAIKDYSTNDCEIIK
jgi:hypothetical protein